MTIFIRKRAHRWATLLVVLTVSATSLLQVAGIKPVFASYTNTYPWGGAPCAATGANLGHTTGTGYWCSNYDWGENPCPSGDGKCTTAWLMNGYYLLDQWGEGFRNCVSYTAWQLKQIFNVDTTSSNTNGWGDASNWNTAALAAGYSDDSVPVVGDIAQWNLPSPWGHTAYVYNVVNGVATYAEYNHPQDGTYQDTLTSASGSQGAPDHYIHIAAISGSQGSVGGATYTGGDGMASATTMLTNYYLTSANVQYALVFQTDGNLVLYNNGAALWSSGTGGQGGTYLDMQSDGNLVIYKANHTTSIWQSGTGGHTGSTAKLQSDGNFVVYSSTGSPLWWTGTGGHTNLTYFGSDRQTAGQSQTQNQYLRSSDGRYALLMQSDGNAVLYSPGYHILWQSSTLGAGDTFTMQTDGNLVLYALGTAKWQSGTSGSNNYAVVQTDGNFVVYNSSNYPLWQSGTGGKI